MKYIDLFAGIGGFRLGLDSAGHECVWTNEWLKKPASIYEKNFGDKPDTRDIRTITADDIPYADLIVGGFPCATFSIAGKRSGFSLEDTRGTLCFEMFRLARDKGIPYILFENVKGLLNHDSGRTFEVILGALDAMGYDAQWELLDSQNFGVPQHRERIFLIANLRGKPRPQVFPLTTPSGADGISDEEEREEGKRIQAKTDKKLVVGTLLNRLYGGDSNNPYIESAVPGTIDGNYAKGGGSRTYVENPVTQWRRGHFRDYKSDGTPTLTANMGTGGHNVPFIYSPHNLSSSERAYTLGQNPQCLTAKAGQVVVSQVPFVRAVLTPDRAEKRQSGRRFKEDGEPAFTLGAQDRHGVMVGYNVPFVQNLKMRDFRKHYNSTPTLMASGYKEPMKVNGVRKLTPIECERLQGFPDNFTKYYADGTLVSDSERYERCGRTVSVPVIKAIGKKLYV